MVPPLGLVVRYTLRVFGIPVLSLDVDGISYVTEDDCRIEGGSAHNFERDVNPVTPEDRYSWEEWDGFGFGSR